MPVTAALMKSMFFVSERLAEQHQHRMRVEPAFAGTAERAGRDALRRTSRESAAASAAASSSTMSAPSADLRRMIGLRGSAVRSRWPGSDSRFRESRCRRLRRIPPSSRRNRPSVNCDRRMFSGTENCWRIEAQDSVVAEWANCGSRSMSAMEPGKPFLAQIIGDRASDDRSADDDDIVSRHVVRSDVRTGAKQPVSPPSRQGLARVSIAGQEGQHVTKTYRPRRSVLYVPASNDKALAKIASLACDAVIIDLEDAVAPADKVAARENLRRHFREPRQPAAAKCVIRINAARQRMGRRRPGRRSGLQARRRSCCPRSTRRATFWKSDDVLDDDRAPDELKLWAMIETPKALLNIGAIAELGRDPASRLDCFVAGTNDLIKDTGILATPDRRYLTPWLMQMVLAARAGGLDVLDGVCNDFRDLDAFARECAEGAAMGFRRQDADPSGADRAGEPRVFAVAKRPGRGEEDRRGLRLAGKCRKGRDRA